METKNKELPGINPQTFKIVLDKPYWQILNEEYNVFPNGEIMDGDLDELIKKDREQSAELIEKYGESAWNIWRFMELCRAEDISESFFRQLVRYEMDKCFKKLNNEK